MALPASPNAGTRNDPYTAGNFLVEIDGISSTAFSEVSGLELSIDVVDYREGNATGNNARKLPGLDRYSDVTLKRGLTQDASLWNWIKQVADGDISRATVSIVLLDQADNPVVRWRLRNAWPRKWTGPVLNAKSSEVAIESLEIAHEGLELVTP